MINWGPYLESVCREYDRWWEVYTLTDVAGKKPHEQGQNIFPSFDLGLMVQRVKSEEKQGKDPQEKIERLTVLEGLRKYAANHVLLVGRPGSGKSTALARLLLEEAHKVWSGENGQIPILIELRYSKSSVLSRIQAFIDKHNHNTYIDEETLKSLLLQGKFLLLFDGFNEMASEEARQQVRMFRQDYPETAMVFSTRDLSLGGDLRIEKKLEMQPLTESQMQDFVCAYLPEQGENLWGQLQGRLRELGETPMFLLMLCSVFDYNKVIPAHLGLVFRGFTQTYSGRIKQDVLVDESSRRWWDRLLQELAWVMTTGGSKTEMMVAIPRKKAEDVLADFLRGQVVAPTDCAMGWLEDLLEYHLIQVGDDGQISFRHQLLQEYYAAERLSSQLSGLSDYELQWDYLNYLKWTEVVALMLGLVEDEVLAVRVVRLALEVDWFLGARLVGEVKEKFQEAAFAEVDGLELPGLAKVVLAGLTMSEVTVPRLVQFLEHSDKYMRGSAAHALGKIASEKAIEELIPLLKDSDEYVRWSAAYALGEIGSETAIEGLIPLLKDSDSFVCWSAANAMGKIGSQKAIEGLIPLLKDSDSFVRYAAAEALGKIDSEKAIEGLIPLLKDSDPNVNFSARSALSQIGSEKAIEQLIPLLKDSDEYVRYAAAEALGKIGSEKAIEQLIPLLKDSDPNVRRNAAEALGEIGSETVIEQLIPLLKYSDPNVRYTAAEALGKIGSEKAIEQLIPLLKDSDPNVRRNAAEALGEIGSETVIEQLIPLLKYSDPNVRYTAAEALGKIGSEKAIEQLIPLLKDSDPNVRRNAAEALGEIGSETVIEQLIPLLKYSDPNVRYTAAEALGKIGSEKAIEQLIPLLKDSDPNVRYTAAEALGKIGSEKAIEQLIPLLKDSDPNVRRNAAYALGEIGSEKAIEGLIPLLKDSDSFVRSRAAYVLGEIGSEKAIEQLIPLLKDSDYWVRDHVAEALGKIGSENTIIKLTKKLQNDSFVKQDLYKIIKIIQTIQQRLQYYKPTPKIPMSKSLSHNYALLIGVGDYKYPDWSLPVTVKDVQAIKSFLTNPDLCSYIDDENHLRLLCNEQATKQNILNNINWLQEQAKNDPEATILVYYSGHGWLDKSTEKYYLIPHDTSPIKLQKTQKTALPATDFNNALQEISAQKLLVIIDSCHAQGMATAKETDQLDLPENFSQTALPKNLIEDLKKGTGRAVFTSSTGYQLSWIRSDQTMSIYTYHLLEALQGGDNKPGDKYVTLSNLMHHVGKTVPQSAQQQGGEQTPIFDFSQTEDFPVALLRGGKGLPAEGKEKIQLEAQENIRNAITVQQGNAAGGDVKNQVFIDKIEGGGGITFS
ncbi:MAG: HEAT repeat domain-containing protein [Trichodesmium erythraeum GBRTRLIN201]|nr:HEAT repeat domain-containing protein [Trichodesmium erythraeum GBRTRLIN201]